MGLLSFSEHTDQHYYSVLEIWGYIPHCCVYTHQIHEVNMTNKPATTPYYYPA